MTWHRILCLSLLFEKGLKLFPWLRPLADVLLRRRLWLWWSLELKCTRRLKEWNLFQVFKDLRLPEPQIREIQYWGKEEACPNFIWRVKTYFQRYCWFFELYFWKIHCAEHLTCRLIFFESDDAMRGHLRFYFFI